MAASPCPLTRAERLALAALIREGSYAGAARALGKAHSTVEHQLSRCYAVLGVRTGVQAVAVAVANGWVRPVISEGEEAARGAA